MQFFPSSSIYIPNLGTKVAIGFFWGAGGGSSGSGSTAGSAAGNGGDTVFGGILTAGGGVGGLINTVPTNSVGGIPTLGTLPVGATAFGWNGSRGDLGGQIGMNFVGGQGGTSPFMGATSPGAGSVFTPFPAPQNTGCGAGSPGGSATLAAGNPGAGGAFYFLYYPNPISQSVVIGTGGTAGTPGTGGTDGLDGSDGFAMIIECS